MVYIFQSLFYLDIIGNNYLHNDSVLVPLSVTKVMMPDRVRRESSSSITIIISHHTIHHFTKQYTCAASASEPTVKMFRYTHHG